MLSTMQDVPLTVSRILAHGSTVHGESQVLTWTGAEPQRRSFAEVGSRAAQLAHALRDELGVAAEERVGTLMWNNAEHLEAYLAIPSMGAVLHTLNLRLPAEQLIWIVNHAADRVMLVNGTLIPLLAPLLPQLPTLEHLVVAGPGDRSLLADAQARVHDYEELLAGRDGELPLAARSTRRQAAALCYTSGTTGDPKGVLYSHRSLYLHSLQVNNAEAFALSSARHRAAGRADVPRQRLGPAARRVHGRRVAADARPLPAARPARRDDRGRTPHHRRRRAHHLAGPARRTGRQAARCLLPAHGHHRRLRLPARADARLRGAARHPRRARLGHDRDVPAGLRLPPAGRGERRGGVDLPRHPGPLPRLRRGAADRPRRRGTALGRRVRRRTGGPRAVDRGLLLRRRPGRTAAPRGQVQPGRLAAHR